MNGEDFEIQLAEERAKAKPEKVKEKKPGALKTLLKNPLVQLLIPSIAEIGTGGLAPGWTIYVIWAYSQTKKAGGSPNIAEYLMIGGLAATVDIVQIFVDLTGFGVIISEILILPCLILLWAWRISKFGIKSAMPGKKPPKTSTTK